MKYKFIFIVFASIFACLSMISSVSSLSDPDLVGYWSFNSVEGGKVVEDTSGKGNDGEIEGSVKPVNGKLDKALEFDGATGCVAVPHSDSLNVTDDFSFVCWVKTTQVTGQLATWYTGARLIDKDVANVGPDWSVAFTEGKVVFCTGNVPANKDEILVIPDPISDGEWHHIAVTREKKSGTKKIYVDGVEAASVEHGTDLALASASDVTIGGNVNRNRWFSGIIDEAAIYSRVLSATEIEKVINSGIMVVEPERKLAAMWGAIKR